MFRSLKGMADILPGEVGRWQATEARLRRVLTPFGYEEIRPPLLEETDLFARSIGATTDVVQKEMFSFEDKGGTSITLRPEGTASVMRSYLQHHLGHGTDLLRVYYLGPMFRHERPQKGRMRQFHSLGVEAIGSDHAYTDSEVMAILWAIVTAFDVETPMLEINSVGDEACRPKYHESLQDYLRDKSSQLSTNARERIESNPLRVLDSKTPEDQEVVKGAPVMLDFLCEGCKAHLDQVEESLGRASIPFERNPRIVRGLDYYTRTAFEITAGGLGSQNAVAGGGRYDGLAEALGGPRTPATGFGLGIERLLLASRADLQDKLPPRVSFLPLEPKAELEAFALSSQLREKILTNNKRCISETELGTKSVKSALRKANKRGTRFVIILGEDELKTKKALLKDLENGEQEAVPFGELISTILQRLDT